MPDIIITPSSGRLEFVDDSIQITRRHAFTLDDSNGVKLDAPLSAAAVIAPLNVINVTVNNSNVNYPFVLASGSAETGTKTLMMDGSGGTYNPFTNTATIDISGNSATTTLASNSSQLNGQSDSYYTNITARLGYTPVNKAGDTVSGNLTVNGNFLVNGSFTAFSASNIYLSSSVLTVEDNILTLNAFSPYLRYAGIEMYDSGSGTLSQLLWDGEGDYFFLTGSSVNGKIITGPDGQTNLSSNYIPKATAGYKLGNSLLYDNGTNIGIGTTSPVDLLSVQGNINVNYNSTDANYVRRTFATQHASGNRGANLWFGMVDGGGMMGMQVVNTASSVSPYNSQYIAFTTHEGGVDIDERMRISTRGNVGIGTSIPNTKLAVNGVSSFGPSSKLSMIGLDINSSGTPTYIKIVTTIPVASPSADFTVNIKGFVYGAVRNADISISWHYYLSTFYNPIAKSSGGWAPTIRLSAENGFVAIVLSSPGYWPKFYVESMYSSAYTNQYASGWSWTDADATGNPIVNVPYASNFGNGFVMLTDGNVGIGTTGPGAKLDVNGDIYVRSGYGLYSNIIGPYTGDLTFYTGGSEKMRILSSGGNVGVGTTAAGEKITISGNLLAFGSTGAVGTGTALYLGDTANSRDLAITRVGGSAMAIGRYYPSAWAETIRFTADGNVGIGTTSPAQKLDVVGNIRCVPASSAWAEGLSFSMPTTSSWGGLRWRRERGNADGNHYIGYIGTDTTDDLVFGSNNAGTQIDNNIRITKAGLVGIGTTVPGYKLDVNGVTRFQGIVRFKNAGWNLSDDGQSRFYFDVSGRTYFGSGNGYEWRSQADSALMVLTNSGAVGIGTTSPADKLQVGAGHISIDAGYKYYMDANVGAVAIRKEGTSMVFTVGANDRVYIDNTGSVGIGTSSPATKLHVVGVISGSSFSGAGTGLTGTASGLNIGGNAANITAYTINQNVGTANTPSFAGATINGQLQVNNATPTSILRIFSGGSTAWNIGVGDSSGTNFNITADFGSILINKSTGNIWISGSGINNTVLHSNSTLTAGNLSGTIPSGVLGNSTHYVGTTAIALNRGSASQTLTGVSIDGNAATVGTLSINTSGRNDVANQIVRTDSNGYIQAGWINTTSGDQGTAAIDRVYASYDGYIRYYSPTNFRTVLDVPTRGGSGASGTWSISVTGTAASETLGTVTGRGGSTSTQIVVATAAGQAMYVGRQAGAGYSYGSAGIFTALSDNPNGGSNIFYQGYISSSASTPGGILTYSVRADGQIYTTMNTATGIANNSFSVAKTVLGTIHIANGSGTSGNNRQAAITFQGDSATEAQAGIYVSNNNSSGTAMGFATTDSYGTGPQLFMTATNAGVVNFSRARPTYAGNALVDVAGGQTIAGITYFSNGESMNVYGIRGRFTNEYLHLYNKVGVGHPGGWGQGEGNTPSQGLSTYGGISIAYGTNAASIFYGNVGVGTTSVSARVESYYSSNAITFNYLATNLNNNSPIPVYGFDVTNGSGETRSIKAGIGYERHLTNGRGTLHFYNDSTNDTSSISGTRLSAGDIKLSIDNAGNVGIGTTIPSWLLTVYAASAPQFALSNGTRSFILTNNSADNLLSFYYNSANRLQFDLTNQWFNTGNVGIGTTSPSALLNVRASAPTGTGTVTTGTNVLIDSNTNNYITFRNTADNGTYAGLVFLDNNVGGYIAFGNAGAAVGSDSMIYGAYQDHIFQNNYVNETLYNRTETMRIKQNGNVGIGSNNPGYKLDVNGAANFNGALTFGTVAVLNTSNNANDIYANIRVIRNTSSTLNDGMYIGYDGTGTTAAHLRFYANGTNERMRIQANDGNVGIGTSSAGRKLDVEGIVRTRGASGTGGFEISAASSGAAKWRIEWDSASDSLDFNWVG